MKRFLVAAPAVTLALLVTSPAVAYDPCDRARREVEELEVTYNRWVSRNCRGPGHCTNLPRGLDLADRLHAARQRRSNVCR